VDEYRRLVIKDRSWAAVKVAFTVIRPEVTPSPRTKEQ
jgi:hypothetical protein